MFNAIERTKSCDILDFYGFLPLIQSALRVISISCNFKPVISKKNARLISAPTAPMDSYEAAQSLFPSLARPLQKYLRITRQQPRHTTEGILQHAALCLRHDAGPNAFLEKFLVPSPVMQVNYHYYFINTKKVNVHFMETILQVLVIYSL